MTAMMKRLFTAALLPLFCFPLSAQQQSGLLQQAMDYALKDSLEQAEQCFRKVLKADPNSSRNALIFSNLGTVQRRMGKIDEAIQSYSLALNITPYATSILLNRAAAYLDRGNLDKAYLDYCNVIDLLPDNVEARLFRAYIYMQRRKYDEARIDYNTILVKKMDYKPARLGIILLDQNEGQLGKARDGIDLLIHDHPDDYELYKVRANIALDMKLPDAALIDLETAARLNRKDRETFILLGDVHLQLDNPKAARKAFNKAIELGVSPVELKSRLKQCR